MGAARPSSDAKMDVGGPGTSRWEEERLALIGKFHQKRDCIVPLGGSLVLRDGIQGRCHMVSLGMESAVVVRVTGL